jgi:hypothetical protein
MAGCVVGVISDAVARRSVGGTFVYADGDVVFLGDRKVIEFDVSVAVHGEFKPTGEV